MIRFTSLPPIDGRDIKAFCKQHHITQRELAAAMATQPDHTALSHWLSNRHDPSYSNARALIAALFRIFADQQIANGNLIAQPSTSEIVNWTRTLASGQHPVYHTKLRDSTDPQTQAQTSAQTKDKPAAPAKPASHHWVDVALSCFPLGAWENIIAGARKALNEGLILTSCGPRLSINTQQAFLALVHDNMDPKKAMLMAFKHAVLDRVVDTDAEFFSNLYHTHTGDRVKRDLYAHPKRNKEEPDYYPYIRSYLNWGIIPWVFSAPGAGKTTAMVQISKSMNREFVRVPCSKFLTPEEVFAGLEAKDGTTFPKDGMITAAIRRVNEGQTSGCIINLDEFSRLQTGLSTTFHSLMVRQAQGRHLCDRQHNGPRRRGPACRSRAGRRGNS
jgi:transcriptional regulator with XRE-family HTH domain